MKKKKKKQWLEHKVIIRPSIYIESPLIILKISNKKILLKVKSCFHHMMTSSSVTIDEVVLRVGTYLDTILKLVFSILCFQQNGNQKESASQSDHPRRHWRWQDITHESICE